jgi:hypothetical protein
MESSVAAVVIPPYPGAISFIPSNAPSVFQRLANAAGATQSVTTVAFPPGMYFTIENGAADIRVHLRSNSAVGGAALTSYRIPANQFRSFRNTSGADIFVEVRQDGTAAYECFVWGSSP